MCEMIGKDFEEWREIERKDIISRTTTTSRCCFVFATNLIKGGYVYKKLNQRRVSAVLLKNKKSSLSYTTSSSKVCSSCSFFKAHS